MIPTQMNCSHQGEGWCLACVGKLAADNEKNEKLISRIREFAKELMGAGRCDWYSTDYNEGRSDGKNDAGEELLGMLPKEEGA